MSDEQTFDQKMAIVPHQIRDILEAVKEIKDDIKDMKVSYVTKEVYETEKASQKKRISDLEAQRNWIVVAVFGAIIAQIMQLIFK